MSVITIFWNMKIELNNYPNQELTIGLELAKKIAELGPNKSEAYLVGGCVRDLVRHQLGQTDNPDIHDVDIATSVSLDELAKHFHTHSNNGEKHGTLLVNWKGRYYEVTHFRTDGTYSDGRHPDSIQLTNSFEKDTARRDFTINALGLNWDGEVIDFHGGVEDIKNKVIRAVGDPNERFTEDALRMIRGVRFATNFGYTMDNNTAVAICKNASLISNVSNERIRAEFMKLSDYDEVSDMLMRMTWYGLIKHIALLQGMDIYEVQEAVGQCYGHITKDNLFPIVCYLGSESNIDAAVPTREEKKLWKWLQSYKTFDPNEPLYWTSLVQLASGDYQIVLDLKNPSDNDAPVWFYKMPIARYIAMNQPDMSEISKTVQSMGIPQGKEFGDKVKELLEAEYRKMARAFPKTIEAKIGSSTVTYKVESVN